MKIHELYMSKALRDERYKELKAQGRNVVRRVSTGQLIHPQYIDDWNLHSGRELRPEEKGFGNTIYKTYFSKLYVVEEL